MAATRGRFKGFYLSTVRNFLLCRMTPKNARGIRCNRGTSALQAKSEPERASYEGPEYIPTGKAKNPMKGVGLAWAIGFPSGILLFFYAKHEVDKNRLKQLKVRQRMKEAGAEGSEGGRYRKTASDSS